VNDDVYYDPPLDEWIANGLVGASRFVWSIVRKLNPLDKGEKPGRRSPYDRIISELHGANGEHGVCAWLHCHWTADVGTYGVPDAVHNGIRYEIRTCTYDDDPWLKAKPDDQADVWVLVVVERSLIGVVPYRYRIVGCATRAMVLRDGRPQPPDKYHDDPDVKILRQASLVPLPKGGPKGGLAELNGVKAS
jgi:hypothetical protein